MSAQLATVVEAAKVVDTSGRTVDIEALTAAESASAQAVDQDAGEGTTIDSEADAETEGSGTDEAEQPIRS